MNIRIGTTIIHKIPNADKEPLIGVIAGVIKEKNFFMVMWINWKVSRRSQIMSTPIPINGTGYKILHKNSPIFKKYKNQIKLAKLKTIL